MKKYQLPGSNIADASLVIFFRMCPDIIFAPEKEAKKAMKSSSSFSKILTQTQAIPIFG